jgi:hypothetical protein
LSAIYSGTASVVNISGATLNLPFQVVIDDAGNLYVGNYYDRSVVRIAARVARPQSSVPAV